MNQQAYGYWFHVDPFMAKIAVLCISAPMIVIYLLQFVVAAKDAMRARMLRRHVRKRSP